MNHIWLAYPVHFARRSLTWRITSASRRWDRNCSRNAPGPRRSPLTGKLSRSFPKWTTCLRLCRTARPVRRRGMHFSAPPTCPACVVCVWWTPRWSLPSSYRPVGSSASCRRPLAGHRKGFRCPWDPACRNRLEKNLHDPAKTLRFNAKRCRRAFVFLRTQISRLHSSYGDTNQDINQI